MARGPAADHRVRRPGRVHVLERTACPRVDRDLKDILVYITAFAAVIVVPIELGSFGKIFAAVPEQELLLALPGPDTTGAYGTYAPLALGAPPSRCSAAAKFTPTYALTLGHFSFPAYSALTTPVPNLVLAVVLTPLFESTRAHGPRIDQTAPADYCGWYGAYRSACPM
jgi:hypothetical protein